MEIQPEEFPSEMENLLPKEFLNLWKLDDDDDDDDANFWDEPGDFWTEEDKDHCRRMEKYMKELELVEKKSEEHDDGDRRAAWKPSEMDFLLDISVMLEKKLMGIQEKVHQKMLPLKEGRKEGVRAHKKLMDHFRNYFPDYHEFRLNWVNFKDSFRGMAGNSYITFEDITPEFAMKYTYRTEGVPREGTSESLQIYSVKVAGKPVQQKKKRKVAGSSTQWPLEVFGVVAVRDCFDPRRNLIFYRDRDNCQIITKEDPYLELIGPTHAVRMFRNGHVMIEAELKVKGAVEREDKYLIADGKIVRPLAGLDSVELTSPGEWKMNIAVGGLETCVEATIFIRVINGTWPIGFHGQFAARTASINEKIILIDLNGDDVTSSGVDRHMEQLRHVVSVEASGELIVSFLAWNGEEEVISGEEIFKAKMSGRSFRYHKISSCNLGVLVVWSRIQPSRAI